MRIIFITLSLFMSVAAYSQGGGGGSGPPSITLRYNNIEVEIPSGFEDVLRARPDRIKRDVRDHFFPNSGKQIKNDLCSLLIENCNYEFKEIKDPVDLEIKGAGVIDLQTFKDETPKTLWREENDKIIIDSRVPVINWQSDDGEIHELK
jgi:hypothetical protein